MSKAELRGADALISALNKRADLNLVKETVKLNGSELQKNMQRDAPVDTGFLKRSIDLNIIEDGLTAHIGVGAHYAPYLIFGTRYMYMRDFFRSNFYKQRQQFEKDLERLMK